MAKRDVNILIKARDDASSKFKKVNKSATGLNSALTTFAGGAVGGAVVSSISKITASLSSLANKAIDVTMSVVKLGDEIGKSSKRIGISTEEFQKLTFAARRSGATTGDIERGFKRLASTIFDAGRGVKESTDALQLLQLEYADLQALTPEQQFSIIADRLNAVEDATTKAALAQDIFGRAGTNLIPMLSDYRDLSKEIQDLGGIISDEDVKAAERFTDEIENLATASKVLVTKTGIVRLLADAAEGFTEMAKSTDRAKWALVDYVDQFPGVGAREALSLAGIVEDQDIDIAGPTQKGIESAKQRSAEEKKLADAIRKQVESREYGVSLGKLMAGFAKEMGDEVDRTNKELKVQTATQEKQNENIKGFIASLEMQVDRQKLIKRGLQEEVSLLDRIHQAERATGRELTDTEKARVIELEKELQGLRKKDAEKAAELPTSTALQAQSVRFLTLGRQQQDQVPRAVTETEKHTKDTAEGVDRLANAFDRVAVALANNSTEDLTALLL